MDALAENTAYAAFAARGWYGILTSIYFSWGWYKSTDWDTAVS